MTASLHARDITLALGARHILDDGRPRRRPAASASVWSAPTASASRRCCGCWPASSPPTRAAIALAPRRRQRRLPAAGDRNAPTETVARAPRPPHRCRCGIGRARCDDGRRWRPATADAGDRYSDRARPVACARCGRLRRRASARCGPTSACRSGCSTSDAGALGWRGGAGGARRAVPRPVRRVPARRTDERPRSRRAWPGWSGSSLGLAAGCVIVSHDRTFLQRTITHVVELDEFEHTATRFAGGWDAVPARARGGPRSWRGRRTRSTTPSARLSPGGRSASASGRRRACRGRRRSRRTTTRTSRRSRSTRPSSWPAGQPAPTG